MKTENLFSPESLIHILEKITMTYLQIRDYIYVSSLKHAIATTAHGTHRLEEFRHWGNTDRADSSSCRDRASCLLTKLIPVMLVPQKGNYFKEKEMQVQD